MKIDEREHAEVDLERSNFLIYRTLQTIGRSTWRTLLERDRDGALNAVTVALVARMKEAGWRVFVPWRDPRASIRDSFEPEKPQADERIVK